MLLFANNARSTLRSAITAASPTLLLEIGTGDLFPLPADGDTFLVTLQDDEGRIEVVEIDRRTEHILYVAQRGMDGTSAKAFEAGTVVSMRVTAELLRRISADALRGAENGVAPLDANQRLPVDYLPMEAVTRGEGDERYARMSELNKPDNPPRLTSNGMLPTTVIPTHYLTSEQGEERYVRKSALGTAGNPPALGTNGKLAYGVLPFTQADFNGMLPSSNPQMTGTAVVSGNLSVSNTATISVLRVTSEATIAELSVSGASAFANAIRIRGGSPIGRRTVSTSGPSGTPADGDEWLQYGSA